MAEPAKGAGLRDVINYQPDDYFSPDELSLIRSTFKDKRVLNVLRKMLVPSVSDPDLPLEEFGKDFFLAARDYASIKEEDLKAIVLGRQEALKFIMGGLIQLKVIANSKAASPEEEAYRRSKDSTK